MIMFRNKFTKKMQNKVNTDKYNFINLETKENIEKNSEIKYTLEEQREESLTELLGLMTADKLDKIKDGKLISLLVILAITLL